MIFLLLLFEDIYRKTFYFCVFDFYIQGDISSILSYSLSHSMQMIKYSNIFFFKLNLRLNQLNNRRILSFFFFFTFFNDIIQYFLLFIFLLFEENF